VAAGLAAAGLGEWVKHAVYTPAALQQGHVWTLLTYPFVHDIRQEGIWFAMEMLMLFWFGREVESAIGRKPLAFLYATLAVGPALILAGLAPWLGSALLAGSGTISFAIFLAFCALHPGAQFFFGLSARWVGWILLGVYSLTYFAGRDWAGGIQMWVSAFLAVLWVRQGGVQWPKISFVSKTKNQAKKKSASRKPASSIPVEKVDAILEKISKEGMGSLTAAEKKLLEETRAKLLQKDRQIPPVR
jgi:membrane associated rhomboid family serine protease